MRAMLLAFAATIVIAIAANFTLNNGGFSAQASSSGPAVRLN